MVMKKHLKAVLAMAIVLLLIAGAVYAQEGAGAGEAAGTLGGSRGIIALAAALALGISAVAAAYGIAHAGSAAMAAMAEKPEIATWAVIIVALAEGLALYGLVIAFMIVGKI